MNWRQAGADVLKSAKKHSPELLVVLGVVGFVGTVIMAVKTTPKAQEIIRKEERRKNGPLTTKEKVAATWKVYVPTAVTGIASVACVLGGTATNCKRNAALAAAYATSESTMRIYREKVIETLGEKKEKIVRDEVAKEQIRRDPIESKQVFITPRGKTLCYDPLSGRYFESDIEQIKKAVEELNKRLRNEMFVTLNEYYDLIGLPAIKMGDVIGWSVDDHPVDPYYTSQLASDDRPCFVIDMDAPYPKRHY